MGKIPSKAEDFLKAMRQSEPADPAPRAALPPPPIVAPAPPPGAAARAPRRAARPPSRAGLKHFGGYLHDDTLEKIALLRARLKLDNSQLMTLAIDELYARQKAKRAFGDG